MIVVSGQSDPLSEAALAQDCAPLLTPVICHQKAVAEIRCPLARVQA
jgi:hypothetical protein